MTTRKKTPCHTAKDALSAERLYKVLADTTPELIFIIDPDDRVLFVNPAAARSLRKTPEQIIGSRRADLFPPETNAHQAEALQQVLRTGESFRSQREMRFGGRTVWLDAILVPLLDEDGKPYAVMGISRDITEIKQSTEALRAAKDYLDKIINSVPTPIFIKDSSSRYILVNNAACSMTGKSREDFIGHTDRNVFPPDVAEGILRSDQELLRTGREVIREISIDVPGSGRRTSLSRKTRYENTDGTFVIVGVANDITGLRRMEDDLARGQTLRSLSVFAGGIAHDFNNLLTAVIGNVNIARAKAGAEGILGEALEDIETAAHRAKDLARQLLTFSKGGAPITDAMRIEDLLRDTANFALRGTNVQLEADLPEGLWPVEADPSQIAQALQNILLNARDAMPKGGRVRLSAENVAIGGGHALLREGRYVRVIVEDSGTGIPPEVLPNIFDPYFTTKQQGSGLGLAIAYSVVRRHEGNIEVDSRPGKGTTFRVLLPASERKLQERASEQYRKGSGRVLIMDDEDVILTTAARILATCGYETVCAKDGAEAVARFSEARKAGRPFHAVILDLTVPGGVGGEEAVKRILDIDPEARVIASTGYSEDAVLADFRKYGFTGIAPKPYTMAALSEAVAKTLKK